MRGVREAVLLTAAFIALFLVLALVSYDRADPGWSSTGINLPPHNLGGLIGAWIADISLSIFGWLAFTLPWVILGVGLMLYRDKPDRMGENPGIRGAAMFIVLIAACALCGMHAAGHPSLTPQGSGGIVGSAVALMLIELFSPVGASLLLLMIVLGALPLALRFSWLHLMDALGAAALQAWDSLGLRFAERKEQQRLAAEQQNRAQRATPSVAEGYADAAAPETAAAPTVAPAASSALSKIKRKASRKGKSADVPDAQLALPIAELESGGDEVKFTGDPLPPVSMFDLARQDVLTYSDEDLAQMSRDLEGHLADFGVTAEVVNVAPGPVITRFELQPAPGVKVSRISNLSRDLARALSIVSLRVVEVIPGKSVIGIEIPNRQRAIVSLRGVFESPAFINAKSPLTLALGQDIAGVPTVADLGKMPHLLVAGTTGSGKSVAVNAMILSLLCRATADEVRLIMIDPKMLELSVYEGIPHLLAPVVTDMKEAANALRWAVAEMDKRYRLMAALGVRNIAGLNKKIIDARKEGEPIRDPLWKPAEEFDDVQQAPDLKDMPYIVIIIDELADMMMVVGKKVEELIARLAQKARAAGIHLIIATQRPSVDVITGLIKANVPSRMAFQVASKTDSRVIIDQPGAEALLGHGDMLYSANSPVPRRVHGAFVDDHEVHKVVNYLKQVAPSDYHQDILNGNSDNSVPGMEPGDSGGGAEADVMYDQAVQIVTESRKASISWVQRRLKIGYNRAARIVEDMEAAGVVTAPNERGQREVVAPPPVEM
ncbi:MAG: DNA translocase FtsK [Oceanococcus sp.]